MHAYTVVCSDETPETVVTRNQRFYDHAVFSDLEEAEQYARTYDETHDGARCTTRHRVFQINFTEIPRESDPIVLQRDFDPSDIASDMDFSDQREPW